MPQAEIKLHPIDVLRSRLEQAFNILVCISNTYDDQLGYMILDEHLNTVLWAVEDGLKEVRTAFSELLEENRATMPEVSARGAA